MLYIIFSTFNSKLTFLKYLELVFWIPIRKNYMDLTGSGSLTLLHSELLFFNLEYFQHAFLIRSIHPFFNFLFCYPIFFIPNRCLMIESPHDRQ